jgi:hypothetical protein
MKFRNITVAVLCTVIAVASAIKASPAYGQDTLTGRADTVANGVQITWTQLQPQPFDYLIYRAPSGRGFPKRVDPDFNSLARRWLDSTAKHGVNYRYRVCAAYSSRGEPTLCSSWFR